MKIGDENAYLKLDYLVSDGKLCISLLPCIWCNYSY